MNQIVFRKQELKKPLINQKYEKQQTKIIKNSLNKNNLLEIQTIFSKVDEEFKKRKEDCIKLLWEIQELEKKYEYNELLLKKYNTKSSLINASIEWCNNKENKFNNEYKNFDVNYLKECKNEGDKIHINNTTTNDILNNLINNLNLIKNKLIEYKNNLNENLIQINNYIKLNEINEKKLINKELNLIEIQAKQKEITTILNSYEEKKNEKKNILDNNNINKETIINELNILNNNINDIKTKKMKLLQDINIIEQDLIIINKKINIYKEEILNFKNISSNINNLNLNLNTKISYNNTLKENIIKNEENLKILLENVKNHNIKYNKMIDIIKKNDIKICKLNDELNEINLNYKNEVENNNLLKKNINIISSITDKQYEILCNKMKEIRELNEEETIVRNEYNISKNLFDSKYKLLLEKEKNIVSEIDELSSNYKLLESKYKNLVDENENIRKSIVNTGKNETRLIKKLSDLEKNILKLKVNDLILESYDKNMEEFENNIKLLNFKESEKINITEKLNHINEEIQKATNELNDLKSTKKNKKKNEKNSVELTQNELKVLDHEIEEQMKEELDLLDNKFNLEKNEIEEYIKKIQGSSTEPKELLNEVTYHEQQFAKLELQLHDLDHFNLKSINNSPLSIRESLMSPSSIKLPLSHPISPQNDNESQDSLSDSLFQPDDNLLSNSKIKNIEEYNNENIPVKNKKMPYKSQNILFKPKTSFKKDDGIDADIIIKERMQQKKIQDNIKSNPKRKKVIGSFDKFETDSKSSMEDWFNDDINSIF